MADKDKKGEPFLKRRDWFLSAAIIFLIYLILFIGVYVYRAEEGYLENVIHVLPLIAGGLVVLGFFEKRKKEEALRERKMKRYRARLELERMQREKKKGQAKNG